MELILFNVSHVALLTVYLLASVSQMEGESNILQHGPHSHLYDNHQIHFERLLFNAYLQRNSLKRFLMTQIVCSKTLHQFDIRVNFGSI